MSLANETPQRRLSRAWGDRLLCIGALSVISVLAVGIRPLTAGVLAVAAVTVDLVRIDVREHRLPNRLVLPMFVIVLGAVASDAAVARASVLPALAAGGAVAAFLLVLSFAGGMGMGDVKLGGALALCLGGIGLSVAVAGIVLAFVLGAIGGIIAVSRRQPEGGERRWARRIPFGPFLLAGFWLMLLVAAGAGGSGT